MQSQVPDGPLPSAEGGEEVTILFIVAGSFALVLSMFIMLAVFVDAVVWLWRRR